MKQYFLTIHKHQVKDYVSVQDIEDLLKSLRFLLTFKVIKITYEISRTYNQLHAHLLVQTNKVIYYKKYSSIDNFRLYWLPAVDGEKIFKYMTKDSSNKYEQQQIIITNYYRHHYGFKQPDRVEAIDTNGNDF